MDIKDLVVFQTVAELGTVTEAAKELNYVQSNITSRLQKLEQHLNTSLFIRHRKGMSLTPEGRKLMNYSKKILALTDEMEKLLQSKTEPAGELHIGTVQTVINLPHILNSYNKKYDQVDLSLYTGVTENLREDVLNYKLDGAFVVETEPHPDLEIYPVFDEQLVLISNRDIKSGEKAKQQPFLCFSKGCAYRRRLEAWFSNEDIRPKKVMELGSFETILSSVAIGLGMTFVPKTAVEKLIEKKRVRAHKAPAQYSQIKTIFIRRKDATLTTTMEKFIETIDYVKEMTIEPLTF